MNILPWQGDLWRRVDALRDKLPHGWLIKGRAGIGKSHFAQAWAKALLCESPLPEGYACNACPACGWFEQGNHPDFRLVEPEQSGSSKTEDSESTDRTQSKKPRQIITVDPIRELTDFVNISSHRRGLKVILICPAEAMNVNAANALLKTLEEPPAGTIFLLVSHRPAHVLPTIRSRCQPISMAAPDRLSCESWLRAQGIANPQNVLAESGYAPLTALELEGAEYREQREKVLGELAAPEFNRLLDLAARIHGQEIAKVVGLLQKWCYDLTSCSLTGQIRYHPGFEQKLRTLASRTSAQRLDGYQKKLLAAQRAAHHTLNARLLFEDLLLAYWQTVVPSREPHR